MLVAGVGIGFANPALVGVAIGVVPPARSGMASGINNTFRLGGVATGIAVLGAIFQHRISQALSGRLSPALAAGVGSRGTRVADGVPAARHSHVVEVARTAFVGAFSDILLVGSVTTLVGGLVALALIRAGDFERADGSAAEASKRPRL